MLTGVVNHIQVLVKMMTNEDGDTFYPWDALKVTDLYPEEEVPLF